MVRYRPIYHDAVFPMSVEKMCSRWETRGADGAVGYARKYQDHGRNFAIG